MIEVGARAPEFELADQAGNPVSLGRFRGRKVVLYFYPKAEPITVISSSPAPRQSSEQSA